MVAEGNGRSESERSNALIVSNRNYEWQSDEARLVAHALENGNGKEPDLDAIDVCAITPLDALNLLYMMQKKKSKARK
jgi:DNA mismatch repair protein MutS